jgi:hypothetical protein
MMRTRFLILSGLLTLAAAPGCLIVTDDDDPGATLEVWNDSDFVITDIYLTQTTDRDWGPNLLDGDVLLPDERIVLVDINCDFYDAQLIDEDGITCELYDLDLCANDALWRVGNNLCSVWNAKESEPAATVDKKPLPDGHTAEKQKAEQI